MAESFELVNYPFKISNKKHALIYRVHDEFEMRFSRSLTSKRVISKCSRLSKTFLEIEIDGESARIISASDHIHEFHSPADFYIPISEEAEKFYSEIHTMLTSENIEEMMGKINEITARVEEGGFPEIVMPLTTTCSHFENYQTAIGKAAIFPKVPIAQIKQGEDIPANPPESSLCLLKEHLTPEQYSAQQEFYSDFYSKVPITRFKRIAEAYKNRDSAFQEKISLHILKRCVCLHAYYMVSGPWRMCWIRLGYDPRADQNNYIYQSIEIRSRHLNFQVFQRVEIVAEVSKNKDWYLLKEYDPTDGFISKALWNFIIYTIDNAGTELIDKRIEEIPDSDFEIFEI